MARRAVPELLCDASHAAYLTHFLGAGFATLGHLERLDPEPGDGGEDPDGAGVGAPELPGLGPEKAAKLLASCAAEPSLLSVVYWVVCAYALLGAQVPPELAEHARRLILACRRDCGGFAPHPDHEPHLLSTLSAVQLGILLGIQDDVSADERGWAAGIIRYVRSLRSDDGSFRGRDALASEGDSRFVYAALCAYALLGAQMEASSWAGLGIGRAEIQGTVEWLLRCQNIDGGFGCRPDGLCESHAGHTFCALASLALSASVCSIAPRSRTRLVRWLCDRQCAEGGLNGRPGKAPDVCYTWWTLASTELLCLDARGAEDAGSVASAGPDGSHSGPSLGDFFKLDELCGFIARCVGPAGGVAAHPGDDPDPFHTFFGLAGFSLLDHARAERGGRPEPWVARVSPRVALPAILVPADLVIPGAGPMTAEGANPGP